MIRKLYKCLKKYWTLKKPIYLKHKEEWNGEVIIPIHAEKKQNKVSDF